MSFYVTLPSTASMDVYTDNTTSSYTTILQSPLQLDGSWEVALVGFTYRQSISTYIGTITINQFTDMNCGLRKDKIPYCANIKFVGSVEIVAYEGEKYQHLLDRINSKLDEIKLKNNQTAKLIVKDHLLYLEIDDEYFMQFSREFRPFLGSRSVYYFNQKPIENKKFYPQAFLYSNEYFFIYTDIIVDQYVGDSKSKLLDTLALEGKKGEAVTITPNNPHYVDVNMNEISTINITIRNSVGIKVHFDNFSRVVVKLHFRPKRYE